MGVAKKRACRYDSDSSTLRTTYNFELKALRNAGDENVEETLRAALSQNEAGTQDLFCELRVFYTNSQNSRKISNPELPLKSQENSPTSFCVVRRGKRFMKHCFWAPPNPYCAMFNEFFGGLVVLQHRWPSTRVKEASRWETPKMSDERFPEASRP